MNPFLRQPFKQAVHAALIASGLGSSFFAIADTTQYIVFNRAPGQGMYQGEPDSLGKKAFDEVLAHFPNAPDKRVRTAVSHIFSVFRTPPETTVAALRVFLAAAEETGTPVVVQFDTEHWWDARPDLWNWWDETKPGFDFANRENVEWTGWSPEDAIRIAWRDWGKQIRVLPQPNLASPRFVEACKTELRRLIPIVLDWHGQLPAEKKHLLIGIKLGHETSIGGSACYFDGGNELLEKPAAEDPVRPFEGENVLNRGRAQLGYAAVKASGIRTSGDITESDLRDVCQRYLATLCREASQLGVPREKLFAHGVGWKDGELLYDVPVNPHACPAWSFYKHAADPRSDTGVQRNIARSDAPHWAACEYWLPSGDAKAWRDALTNTLSDPRCRYVCVFNWESLAANPGISQGIHEVLDATPHRVIETIFRQPDLIDTATAGSSIIGEVHPGSEKFYVRLGNYGKTTPLVGQTWDAGRFTGLSAPAGFQRGLSPEADSTAVQLHGREIGIWIDSDHPRPALGSLLPITPAFWWWDLSRAPMPFRDADRVLTMSFDLKVPTALFDGGAVPYVTTNFLFRDTRSEHQFWLAAILVDPRGEARFPDTVHVDDWEGGTQLPILFSALNHKSQWLHPGPDSALFTDKPFVEYRSISVRVTAAELQAALVAMKKAMPKLADASEDPRDYQLIHFNLNPEVFAPAGSRGRLGVAVRDLRVELR
jgi:hypothetical protein